jgi:cytochrome c6
MNCRKMVSEAKSSGLFRIKSLLAVGVGMLLVCCLNGALHAADIFKGGQLYASNCALCHGSAGISVMPGAPSFARGDGMLRPDMTLLAAIRSGKNAMPAFQGMLSDRDIMGGIAC